MSDARRFRGFTYIPTSDCTHRLVPTTSTVHGVNSSFIQAENGDERLDCACAVVTVTGLNLSLQWLDAGKQGCSGAGIILVGPCSFGLSKFQEVRPVSTSFQLPKSTSYCVIQTVTGGDVLKKGLFGRAFQQSSLHFETNTIAFSSTHMKCGRRAGEKQTGPRSFRGPWHVNLPHEYRQAPVNCSYLKAFVG